MLLSLSPLFLICKASAPVRKNKAILFHSHRLVPYLLLPAGCGILVSPAVKRTGVRRRMKEALHLILIQIHTAIGGVGLFIVLVENTFLTLRCTGHTSHLGLWTRPPPCHRFYVSLYRHRAMITSPVKKTKPEQNLRLNRFLFINLSISPKFLDRCAKSP